MEAFFNGRLACQWEHKLCSVSRWLTGIPPLLWDWLYCWSDPKKGLLARSSFDLSFRYIDDVSSLTNHSYGDGRIYPKELQIMDTYRHYEISIMKYNKRDDFSFRIINFLLFVATSLFISQLLRYDRTFYTALDFYSVRLARWEPSHSFPFLFCLPRTFYEQHDGCFKKSRGHLPLWWTWSIL